jgi:hypothetical protein
VIGGQNVNSSENSDFVPLSFGNQTLISHGFSKALDQSQRTETPPRASPGVPIPNSPKTSDFVSGMGSTTPPSGSSKRLQTLPAIIQVWNRTNTPVSCVTKVIATNELWIATSFDPATLQMCDNAVSQTGSLDLPSSGLKVVAMAATEEHVWSALSDGQLLLWDPLERSLQAVAQANGHQAALKPKNLESDVSRPLTSLLAPVTAMHATQRPNDVMSIWTAHKDGIIRQWIHGKIETTFHLSSASIVTSIADVLPSASEGALPTKNLLETAAAASSAPKSNSFSPQRVSSSLGPSLWFALAPNASNHTSATASGGCRILVTDSNLQPISNFSAHLHSSQIFGMLPVGNKVWTCGDDGIMVWNGTSCEMEKHILPLSHVRSSSSSSSSSSHTHSNAQPKIPISCLVAIPNPLQTGDANAHALIWAFAPQPHNTLYVYDSHTTSCVRTMPLQLAAGESVKSSILLAKDRVLTISSSGSLSLWGFQKPDRLSKQFAGSPGSNKIISSPNGPRLNSPRRPLRQAPSFPPTSDQK